MWLEPSRCGCTTAAASFREISRTLSDLEQPDLTVLYDNLTVLYVGSREGINLSRDHTDPIRSAECQRIPDLNREGRLFCVHGTTPCSAARVAQRRARRGGGYA